MLNSSVLSKHPLFKFLTISSARNKQICIRTRNRSLKLRWIISVAGKCRTIKIFNRDIIRYDAHYAIWRRKERVKIPNEEERPEKIVIFYGKRWKARVRGEISADKRQASCRLRVLPYCLPGPHQTGAVLACFAVSEAARTTMLAGWFNSGNRIKVVTWKDLEPEMLISRRNRRRLSKKETKKVYKFGWKFIIIGIYHTSKAIIMIITIQKR